MTKDMINNGVNSDDKSRIIQEYVPGKQITLAHMVRSLVCRMIIMMQSAF